MELAFAIILISCFTCVGLLALWAATSARHWFVRAIVFLAVISLTLLIPAYEIFAALFLQGLVVANGMRIYHWWLNGDRPKVSRFGLADLLLLIACASVLMAVYTQLPTLNSMAWTSVCLIGIFAGMATLLSAWIANGRRFCWWKRVLLGTALACAISVPLISGDWFALSIVSQGTTGWPPEASGVSLVGMFGGWQETDPMTLWLPISIAIVAFISLLWMCTGLIRSKAKSKTQKTASGVLFVALLLGLASPAIYVYYRLLTPLPIPEITLPEDNGFDQLLAAGKIADGWAFNTGMLDPEDADEKTLIAAVEEMASAYEQLAVGLAKPVRLPIDYESMDGWGIEYIQEMRSLARCLDGRAQLAVRQGRIADAIEDHLLTIELGYAIMPDTLMVHALVGTAIVGVGQNGLYSMRDKLDTQQSRLAVERLRQLAATREPTQAFIDRDRIWGQHANGWHGHLVQLITDWAEPDNWFSDSGFRRAMDRELAVSRLLRTELAILQFQADQNRLPVSLGELVPQYLPMLPADPFAEASVALLYRQEHDAFVLYSVGRDGEDDHGVLPVDYQDEPGFWSTDDGDLRLEYLYAPDPPQLKDADEQSDFDEAPQPDEIEP